jgi:hypothetical protein
VVEQEFVEIKLNDKVDKGLSGGTHGAWELDCPSPSLGQDSGTRVGAMGAVPASGHLRPGRLGLGHGSICTGGSSSELNLSTALLLPLSGPHR